MAAEVSDAVVWTLGGTGSVGFVFYVVRYFIRTISADKLAMASNSADGSIVERLQKDCLRLEAIITKQSERIDMLEAKLLKLHAVEVEDAADLAELAVLIENICINCGSVSNRDRLKRVVHRIRDRKARLRESRLEQPRDSFLEERLMEALDISNNPELIKKGNT